MNAIIKQTYAHRNHTYTYKSFLVNEITNLIMLLKSEDSSEQQ